MSHIHYLPLAPGFLVAVNVGGAVIPTLMSIYLLIKRELWAKGTVATAIVALLIHWMAAPVHGLGIAVPVFMPVLATAIVAVMLSREDSAPLAYIAGSLGTLIGADLTNLDKVRGLGAPLASIGGAGTFDGIFLTGILAVLFAGFYAGVVSRPRPGPPQHVSSRSCSSRRLRRQPVQTKTTIRPTSAASSKNFSLLFIPAPRQAY
jgi:hypothetical protein